MNPGTYDTDGQGKGTLLLLDDTGRCHVSYGIGTREAPAGS